MSNKDENTTKFIKIIVWFAAIVFFGYLVLINVCDMYGSKFKVWGVFGDSFGVITALFSSLAFIAAMYTIILQKKEMKNNRKQQDKIFDEQKKANDNQDKQIDELVKSLKLEAGARKRKSDEETISKLSLIVSSMEAVLNTNKMLKENVKAFGGVSRNGPERTHQKETITHLYNSLIRCINELVEVYHKNIYFLPKNVVPALKSIFDKINREKNLKDLNTNFVEYVKILSTQYDGNYKEIRFDSEIDQIKIRTKSIFKTCKEELGMIEK